MIAVPPLKNANDEFVGLSIESGIVPVMLSAIFEMTALVGMTVPEVSGTAIVEPFVVGNERYIVRLFVILFVKVNILVAIPLTPFYAYVVTSVMETPVSMSESVEGSNVTRLPGMYGEGWPIPA